VDAQSCTAAVRDMSHELERLGATFFRVTPFAPDVIVVEGWKVRPEDQGPELTLDDVIGFGRASHAA
jgi:hypothetical protein